MYLIFLQKIYLVKQQVFFQERLSYHKYVIYKNNYFQTKHIKLY